MNESLEANGDHTQSLESYAGLPPKLNVSSNTGIGNSHTIGPTTAEWDQLAHESNELRECEAVDAHEVDATGFQQDLPPLGRATLSFQITNEPDKAVSANVRPSRDLWEEAFTKLDKDKQDLLCKVERPQGPKVVDNVAKQTEQLYREHERRGWQANFKKGFESVLKSVLECRELIGACLASDPTGYAAAAWTIVSLGLQLAQNALDRRQTFLKASEILAGNLVLLAAIEASYRDQTLRDSSNLEDVIVVVYIAILELSAEIVNQNSLSSGKRVLNSVTGQLKSRLQELKETLVDAQEKLSTWTSIIEQQYRTKEGKELGQKVDSSLLGIAGLAQQVSSIAIKVLTAEGQAILNWLSTFSISDSHNSATSRREPGTGAWILSLPGYHSWRTSDGSLLWLYGNCT